MRWIALGLQLMLSSCASDGREAPVQELPRSMRLLGTLLDGCTTAVDGDVARAECGGDVVLSLRSRHSIAGEPSYLGEAYALAQETGARLVWDQIVVPTEGPSGVLDRARAMVPLNETPKAVLLGVVRSLGARDVQEVWCTAKDEAGDRRCRDLVGAILSRHAHEAPKAADAPRSNDKPAPIANGAVSLLGRALSLPTSCRARPLRDGADASCEDGASASWRRFESMEEATETVTSTLAALGFEGEAEPFHCVIGGEAAHCEDHDTAVAGLTYIDGIPVAVLCLVSNARTHALCRALIHEK